MNTTQPDSLPGATPLPPRHRRVGAGALLIGADDDDLPRGDAILDPACPACASGIGLRIYGTDSSDGLVVCATCGAPLFYCDIGGQG